MQLYWVCLLYDSCPWHAVPLSGVPGSRGGGVNEAVIATDLFRHPRGDIDPGGAIIPRLVPPFHALGQSADDCVPMGSGKIGRQDLQYTRPAATSSNGRQRMTRLIGPLTQLRPLCSIIAAAALLRNACAVEDGSSSWAAESSCRDEGDERLCAYVVTGALTCEADFCPSCVNAHQCDQTCSFGDCAPPPPPPLGPCEDAGGDALCAYVASGVLTCEVDFCPSCINAHQCDMTCGGFGHCAPPPSPLSDSTPPSLPPPETPPASAQAELEAECTDNAQCITDQPGPECCGQERCGLFPHCWKNKGSCFTVDCDAWSMVGLLFGGFACVCWRAKLRANQHVRHDPETRRDVERQPIAERRKQGRLTNRPMCKPKCVASAVPAQFNIWENKPGLKYLESTEAAEAASPQEALNLLRIVGGHADTQTRSLPDAALLDPTTRAALMRHADKSAREQNADLLIHLTKDELESLIGALHLRCLITLFGTQPNEFRLRRVVADVVAPQCIPFHTDFSRRTMQIPLNDEHEYDGGYLVFATEEALVVPSRAPGSATIHVSDTVHAVTKMRRGVRYSLYLAMVPGSGEVVDLNLVEPTLAQLEFFKHAILLLNELTNERLLLHVYEYHQFLIEYARDNQLRANLAVELVWRAHLLSPLEYAKDCATILNREEPTVIPHIPRPACEYLHASAQAAGDWSIEDSKNYKDKMPVEWYRQLAMKTRRGLKFMKRIVSLGEISQATIEDEVRQYVQFLQDVSVQDLNAQQKLNAQHSLRKPSLLVDLVWHTHQFHPQNYSSDCVRIGGKIFDHIEDSESDSDSD